MATERQKDEFIECAERINASLGNIFAHIDELIAAVTAIWYELPSRRLTTRDLSPLRPLIDSKLSNSRNGLQGSGMILDPGALEDKEMHSEWRHLNHAGRITPLSLNFNHSSESYYDYRDMPWFARPRDTGNSVVIGPYVDLYGQDMYILTFASPVFIEGHFIGIAGADVALSRLESILIPSLVRLPRETLIVSDEGRVIAANTANWSAGEMATSRSGRLDGNYRSVELGAARWNLVEHQQPRQLAGAA